MDRLLFFQRIIETGVLPLYYDDNADLCRKILDACYRSGAKAFEFTNRGPAALSVFHELRSYVDQSKMDVTLGIGSIIDPQTAAIFVQHGAEFVVGPTFNEELARWCNRRKIAYIPGCSTPKEISIAEEFGAEIVKVFPANVLGPDFIKSVSGPMPWSKLMPTGGVSPEQQNIISWIKAGAVCVGLGSQFFKKTLLKENQFEEIGQSIANTISWVSDARS